MFGKTTLGLTYAMVFAEFLLAPAIPSVAARSGGIFFPLARVSLIGLSKTHELSMHSKWRSCLWGGCQ